MKIAVIEDDEKVIASVVSVLEEQGYVLGSYASIEDFYISSSQSDYDLIILDLKLFGKSGEHLVSDLRKRNSQVPILVLSATTDVYKKVELFDMGVDDYMTKPFSLKELVARVRALYRRHLEYGASDRENYGEIVFFRKQNRVQRGGRDIFLTRMEFCLLKFLLQSKGKVVTVDDILLKVWNAKKGYHSNVIPSMVRRLRRKLDEGFSYKLIRNVYGVGYTFVLPSD